MRKKHILLYYQPTQLSALCNSPESCVIAEGAGFRLGREVTALPFLATFAHVTEVATFCIKPRLVLRASVVSLSTLALLAPIAIFARFRIVVSPATRAIIRKMNYIFLFEWQDRGKCYTSFPMCPDRAGFRGSGCCPKAATGASRLHKGPEILAAPETRKELVAVRLQPSERAHFAAVCKEQGVTMSEGFRRLARAAGGLGPTFDRETKAAVEELSAQTRAVGVNLNQIARAMNQGLVPPDATLRQVLEDIASAIQAYDALYVSMCARSRKLAVESLKDEQA